MGDDDFHDFVREGESADQLFTEEAVDLGFASTPNGNRASREARHYSVAQKSEPFTCTARDTLPSTEKVGTFGRFKSVVVRAIGTAAGERRMKVIRLVIAKKKKKLIRPIIPVWIHGCGGGKLIPERLRGTTHQRCITTVYST